MIQRIQSVFLLVVAICMTVSVMTLIWDEVETTTNQKVVLTSLGLTHSKGEQVIESNPTYYLTALAGLAVVIAFLSLFSYQKRSRQMLLGLVNSLVMVSFMLLAILKISKGEAILNEASKGNYHIAFWLVVVAIISNLLANRFIRKDENLVRSADRLR